MMAGAGAAYHLTVADQGQGGGRGHGGVGSADHHFVQHQVESKFRRQAFQHMVSQGRGEVGVRQSRKRVRLVFLRFRPRHGLREHGSVRGTARPRANQSKLRRVSRESGAKSMSGISSWGIWNSAILKIAAPRTPRAKGRFWFPGTRNPLGEAHLAAPRLDFSLPSPRHAIGQFR